MRNLILALLTLLLLAACPHRVETGRDARFTTLPVCPGAVRRADYEILRAGFAADLELNEVEALQDLEQAYLAYVELAVDDPRTDSQAEAARFGRSLARKRARLDEVVAQYQPFVDSPRVELAGMSLYRIAEAHELLAVEIENTRVPAGSTREQLASFCSDLFESTRSLRATSQRYIARCAEQARQGGLRDRWSQACQRKLATP